MADLTIRRNAPGLSAVLGALSSAHEGFPGCVTLENALLKIPAGTYGVYLSTHHPTLAPDATAMAERSFGVNTLQGEYECPELNTETIGREHIQIHILNTPLQSEGCIGVGFRTNGETIEQSQAAFLALMDHIATDIGWPFTLEILD